MTKPKTATSKPKADDTPRIDAIIKVLKENGLSLGHHPELK